MRRLALAAGTALSATLGGCTGAADAETSPGSLFSDATPRQAILDEFREILNWSAVEIDNTVVLGQNRCVLTVAVSDTARAEIIRNAFAPLAEAHSTNLCPPLVVLSLVPYTRERVELARLRVDSLLADENTGAVTLLTESGEVVVEVKNVASAERARKAIEADEAFPAGILAAIRPRPWMREAENPRDPPLEAYTAVVADHFRRVASPATTVGVLRASLPRGFTERNLQGMDVRIVDDASAVAYLIRFGDAGQLEDGVFTIEAVGNRGAAAAEPRPVGVDCVGRECFLVEVGPPVS